ncbi:MAG: hypothetical protein Q7K43_00470 [Candidatus Woesearchaeota archaeon]|nr:hypothetical protein [Candidatus Woesearchaeota archaeon]
MNWELNRSSGLYQLSLEEGLHIYLDPNHNRRSMQDELKPTSGIALSVTYLQQGWTYCERVEYDKQPKTYQIASRKWRSTKDSMELVRFGVINTLRQYSSHIKNTDGLSKRTKSLLLNLLHKI